MTLSILPRDEETGMLVAAAAKARQYVGGWGPRGDPASGPTAGQAT